MLLIPFDEYKCYLNFFSTGHKETKLIKMFIGNVENIEKVKEAFKDVTCVIHCAAHVSYEFPPDEDTLYKTNVIGNLFHNISIPVFNFYYEILQLLEFR